MPKYKDMGADELWTGGPKFAQQGNAFKVGTDSVLLSSFIRGKRARHACDLGTGCGVLSILLAQLNPIVKIDALEIDFQASKVAEINSGLNGHSDRISVIKCDMRHNTLIPGFYDLVMTNPPYFPRGSGAAHTSDAPYRDERNCTLADICHIASKLLKWGGYFYMVHRPERMSEIFCEMTLNSIEPKRLRLVQTRGEEAPSIILIEGKRGGKPGLVIEKPLITQNPDGSHSKEIMDIYHRS